MRRVSTAKMMEIAKWNTDRLIARLERRKIPSNGIDIKDQLEILYDNLGRLLDNCENLSFDLGEMAGEYKHGGIYQAYKRVREAVEILTASNFFIKEEIKKRKEG